MEQTTVIVILNLVCLGALLWFFDYPYRRFRVDLLRYHLFAVRDRLFDAAAEGKIDFNSPAYGIARQTLNGMIRFAHDISLWRLVVIVSTHQYWAPKENEYASRVDNAMRALTKRQQAVIMKTMFDAHAALVSHAVHTSLLTFPAVMLIKYGGMLGLKIRGAWSRPAVAKPWLKIVDTEAYFCGDDERLAA